MPASNQLPMRIFAVIALYKMQPNDSAALRTLLAAMSSVRTEEAEVAILLYDNTPGGQSVGNLPAGVQYKGDPENGALAAACNYGLKKAHEAGFEWLLTLNQDTTLPSDFLWKLCDALRSVATLSEVAGIFPSISSEGRVVSPFTVGKHWTVTKHIPQGFVGIPEGDVFAANSVSTIRVSALMAIGGFDPRFPLDMIDFDVDYRLHRQKLRFFVAGDIHVELELSNLDLRKRSSAARYEDYLGAEELFCDEYLDRGTSIAVVVKLIYRLGYKLRKNGGGLPYYKIALRFLCRRLFYSRGHRMRTSKQALRGRTAVATASTS
jgi:hypothetical protein